MKFSTIVELVIYFISFQKITNSTISEFFITKPKEFKQPKIVELPSLYELYRKSIKTRAWALSDWIDS